MMYLYDMLHPRGIRTSLKSAGGEHLETLPNPTHWACEHCGYCVCGLSMAKLFQSHVCQQGMIHRPYIEELMMYLYDMLHPRGIRTSLKSAGGEHLETLPNPTHWACEHCGYCVCGLSMAKLFQTHVCQQGIIHRPYIEELMMYLYDMLHPRGIRTSLKSAGG